METYDRLMVDGLVSTLGTPAWLDHVALGLLFGVSIVCTFIWNNMVRKQNKKD